MGHSLCMVISWLPKTSNEGVAISVHALSFLLGGCGLILPIKNYYDMIKQFYTSLRLLIFTTLLLSGAKSAQAWIKQITVDSIKYEVYITGNGPSAVADSAWVALDNDQSLSGVLNIPSFVTCEYHWIEYDEEGDIISHTSYLEAPVTRIEDGDGYNTHGAFLGCNWITQVIIPNTVKHIGRNAFKSCRRLKSVTFGNSVTIIEDNAFSGCDCMLGDLVIPNSVIKIGSCAFAYNRGLSSVSIGNSVRTIGVSAFQHCSWLKRVDITDLEAWCRIKFGMDGNPLIDAHHLYLNGEPLTNLTFPNTIDTIHNYAFMNCDDLINVIIPDSVTTIGTLSFGGCSNLTSVTIGDSVTSICERSFAGCSNMTSLTIGKSVTSMYENYAASFDHLYELSELVWNAKHCENNFGKCFSGLDKLQKVIIGDEVEILPPSFVSGTKTIKVRIPDSVTSIGEGAFSGCSMLKNVTIPSSVTSIGERAFTSCESMESIAVAQDNPHYDSRNDCNAIIETSTDILIIGCKNTVIPSTVTTIGNYAFNGCSKVTSVTIPSSVTSIGESAFDSCKGLETITIPSSVTSIGYGVFGFCTGLSSATINNSVIGRGEFHGCTGLTNVAISDSVTEISSSAFANCSRLKSVSISNSVTLIDEYSFYGCSDLTTLTIGKSVATIGNFAFEGCVSLNDIVCLATTPPDTDYSFDSFIYDKATLHVPMRAIEVYKSTSQWSNFSNIVGLEEDMPPGDTNADGEVNIADVNAVIDVILSGGFSSLYDVNNDGEVNIADINAIIDIILNQ